MGFRCAIMLRHGQANPYYYNRYQKVVNYRFYNGRTWIVRKVDHKTVFIVDALKSDRIQLAKFIKHESFTLMSFTALNDCFKMFNLLSPDLIVYALRKKKADIKKLQTLKRKFKKIHFILVLTKETPEVNLLNLKEDGFASIHKAATKEKVREIAYELLSPEELPRRAETPHPVPFYIAENPVPQQG